VIWFHDIDRISENNNGVFVYGRWDYTPQNRDYLSYQLKFGNDNHSNTLHNSSAKHRGW